MPEYLVKLRDINYCIGRAAQGNPHGVSLREVPAENNRPEESTRWDWHPAGGRMKLVGTDWYLGLPPGGVPNDVAYLSLREGAENGPPYWIHGADGRIWTAGFDASCITVMEGEQVAEGDRLRLMDNGIALADRQCWTLTLLAS